MAEDQEHGPEHEPAEAWKIGEEELRTVRAMSAPQRYGYFVQLAVDWEEAWGLRSPDGWVLSSSGGRDAFPVWPHPRFAEACAHGDWEGAAPESILLDELLEDLLPLLEEDRVQLAVFPTPEGEGVLTSPEELRRDLQAEFDIGS
jgi:hypothetical protein